MLQRWASEGGQPQTVLRNVQNVQLFPNLTFELQWAGYVCTLDAILHLAPPTGPKGQSYNVYIYIIILDMGAFISLKELTLLAKNLLICKL